jgi:hypothetical protein
MNNKFLYAEINVARVPVDANIGGLMFAAATVIIFLLGIPLLWYLFPAAIGAGVGVAFLLRLMRREAAGALPVPSGGKHID